MKITWEGVEKDIIDNSLSLSREIHILNNRRKNLRGDWLNRFTRKVAVKLDQTLYNG